MKQPIPRNWSLRALPEFRALLPASVLSLSVDGRADACLARVYGDSTEPYPRYTGVTSFGLSGPQQGNALDILHWWKSAPDRRTFDCGTLATFTVGLLASVGIMSHLVCATNQNDLADISIQYWSPRYGWVHVLPQCNSYFVDAEGYRQSYRQWTQLEIADGNRSRFHVVSPTGGKCREPGLTQYDGWIGFWRSAVFPDGNAASIDANWHAVKLIQVYADSDAGKPGHTNAYRGTIHPATLADAEAPLCLME